MTENIARSIALMQIHQSIRIAKMNEELPYQKSGYSNEEKAEVDAQVDNILHSYFIKEIQQCGINDMNEAQAKRLSDEKNR